MEKINPELKLRGFWLMTGYALVGLVVYLSMTSSPVKLNFGFMYQDKVFHALAYFALMFWFAQIYHEKIQRRMLVLIFLLQGLLMEYLQSMDSARTAELADMLANTAGVILAFVLTRRTLGRILIKIESVFFRQDH
jgi:VanZ family protein